MCKVLDIYPGCLEVDLELFNNGIASGDVDLSEIYSDTLFGDNVDELMQVPAVKRAIWRLGKPDANVVKGWDKDTGLAYYCPVCGDLDTKAGFIEVASNNMMIPGFHYAPKWGGGTTCGPIRLALPTDTKQPSVNRVIWDEATRERGSRHV